MVFLSSWNFGARSPRYFPVSARTVISVPAPAAAPKKSPGSASAAGATAISPAPRENMLPVREIRAADSPAPAIARPDTLGVRVSIFLMRLVAPVLMLLRARPPERLASVASAAAKALMLILGIISAMRERCRIASDAAAFTVSASALMVAFRESESLSRSCFAFSMSASAFTVALIARVSAVSAR